MNAGNLAVDSLIFDLDGTLWDTCDACAEAWNLVALRHRIAFRTITGDDVRKVAGRPHEMCIRDTFMGLTEPELDVLIRDTQEEDNRAVAERGGVLYPGVAAGLSRLARAYPLFIVSNCQAGYIETFLQWSKLEPYFRGYECWGNTGRPKGDNLRSVIEKYGLRSPWFVGDTEGDEDAALACGVPFLHVTYGFGRATRQLATLTSFDDLCVFFLGLGGVASP